MARQGVIVEPYQRLNAEQIERIHQASLSILIDPGNNLNTENGVPTHFEEIIINTHLLEAENLTP